MEIHKEQKSKIIQTFCSRSQKKKTSYKITHLSLDIHTSNKPFTKLIEFLKIKHASSFKVHDAKTKQTEVKVYMISMTLEPSL